MRIVTSFHRFLRREDRRFERREKEKLLETFNGIASGLGKWSNISGDHFVFFGRRGRIKRIVWNDDVLHATYIVANRKSNKLFQNIEKGKRETMGEKPFPPSIPFLPRTRALQMPKFPETPQTDFAAPS